jgi:hypothetical protein
MSVVPGLRGGAGIPLIEGKSAAVVVGCASDSSGVNDGEHFTIFDVKE